MIRTLCAFALLALVACTPGGTGETCSADSDCDTGALCHEGLQGGPKRCLLTCAEQADCPSG